MSKRTNVGVTGLMKTLSLQLLLEIGYVITEAPTQKEINTTLDFPFHLIKKYMTGIMLTNGKSYIINYRFRIRRDMNTLVMTSDEMHLNLVPHLEKILR